MTISILGLITLAISISGFLVFFYFGWVATNKAQTFFPELALFVVSLSLFYLATALFGVATYIGVDIDIILYPIRNIFMVMNIFTGVLLLSKLYKVWQKYEQ